jgi:hypothetical protein
MRRKIKSGAGDDWAHEIVRSPALYRWRIPWCPPTLLRRRRSRCCPDAGIKPAEAILPMTVANKPGHRGEHEGSRKTIARGMPGNPGVTVVTTLVCFLLCTRGCGRIRRPAFPAPSSFRGQRFTHNLGASRRENADLCLMNMSLPRCPSSSPARIGPPSVPGDHGSIERPGVSAEVLAQTTTRANVRPWCRSFRRRASHGQMSRQPQECK